MRIARTPRARNAFFLTVSPAEAAEEDGAAVEVYRRSLGVCKDETKLACKVNGSGGGKKRTTDDIKRGREGVQRSMGGPYG
jgi:hypothetical protein